MFYRFIGMAVWKFASAYIRRNYGRQLRAGAAAGLLTIAVAAYLATRSGD
jgi:hypothetical protein